MYVGPRTRFCSLLDVLRAAMRPLYILDEMVITLVSSSIKYGLDPPYPAILVSSVLDQYRRVIGYIVVTLGRHWRKGNLSFVSFIRPLIIDFSNILAVAGFLPCCSPVNL